MEHMTADARRRLPRIGLHVRLESAMDGEMRTRFSARQGKALPGPAAELYHYSTEDLSDLQAFLDSICDFMGSTQELEEVAERFSLACQEENILYAETILNPSHWPRFTLPQIVSAVTAGG